MKQINTVWVFADAADRYADLITGAKKTGAKVNAVVVSEAGVQALRASGPDAVYNLDVAAESCVENYAASLAAVITGEGNLVLLDVTKRSKAFAAALSQKLGAALVNDALSLNPAADGLRVTFCTYGGLAVGTEKVLSANAVVTVSGGVFAPEAAESSADLAVTKVAYVAPANALVVKERRAKAQSAVDLTKAKRVVGVGRGIAKEADLALADALAKAIGAEVGCSRPIAEGEHWMERERYIGVSGVLLKGDVYVALGISGQIQHMVGVNDCGTIIAVNKDKNAPIFNYCDYGIVGDIYKVLPELTKALS